MLISKKMEQIDLDKRLNLTPDVKEMLEKTETPDFHVFEFSRKTGGNELYVLTSYLLYKHDLFHALKIDPEIFLAFIRQIQDSYNPTPIQYHNKTHGADVCQTVYYYNTWCNFQERAALDDLELFACIVSPAVHDYLHP